MSSGRREALLKDIHQQIRVIVSDTSIKNSTFSWATKINSLKGKFTQKESWSEMKEPKNTVDRL